MGKNFSVNDKGGKVSGNEFKVCIAKKEMQIKVFYKTSHYENSIVL